MVARIGGRRNSKIFLTPKNIDVRVHFVLDLVKESSIIIQKISSKNLLTNMFTKVIGP